MPMKDIRSDEYKYSEKIKYIKPTPIPPSGKWHSENSAKSKNQGLH